MSPQSYVIRNLQARVLFEGFLLSAVTSILLIRFYLYITGYPQIGGDGLHIAHMLWGGLFMLVAIVLQFSFPSRKIAHAAAVLGGVGFGFFIDELGKFITQDNNYFFQPTIALIYVIFMCLYLLFQAIWRYRDVSEKEYVINAVEVLKEAVINDLDKDEEAVALEYLQKADQKDTIVRSLHGLFDDIEAIKPPRPGPFLRTKRWLRKLYLRLAQSEIISRVVIFVLGFQSLIAIITTGFVIITLPELSFPQWGILLSSVVAAAFVFAGLTILYRNRVRAYEYLRLAVLIIIFLTQFFVFYLVQFFALLPLLFNIAVLLVIEYVLSFEREKLAAVNVRKTS